MGYYRGDYYRGDYYRGDFWSKAKGAAKKIAKNKLVQTAGMAMIPGAGWAGVAKTIGTGLMAASSAKKAAKFVGGAVVGGATSFGLDALLDGAGRRPGGGRRMHVTNVKALRRAMRRVQGFAHLAKSTINFTKTVKMKKKGRK